MRTKGEGVFCTAGDELQCGEGEKWDGMGRCWRLKGERRRKRGRGERRRKRETKKMKGKEKKELNRDEFNAVTIFAQNII